MSVAVAQVLEFVSPNPDEGLTRSDLDRIAGFLAPTASVTAHDDPFA